MNDKNDEKLIELFWSRDENAIKMTQERYRGFANSVLIPFLTAKEDREECLNDALLRLWDSIPPERPKSFTAYFAKILRNLAISRTRAENAWKRGGKSLTAESEFYNDLTDGRTLADDYESARAGRIISEFLRSLSKNDREIFILRYWFGEDSTRISRRTGIADGTVRVRLKRVRDRLRAILIKEGIINE